MQVEQYEPLVRQLCQGIRDPHVRSEAEQEGRIALWRYGERIDASRHPSSMANRYITQGKKHALAGREWTGEGRGSKNGCHHGDIDRRTDGRCRVCRRERDQKGNA